MFYYGIEIKMKGSITMKKTVKISIVSVALATCLFPNVTFAAEHPFEEVDLFRQREAIVRKTGRQSFYRDPSIGWGAVNVLTWRSYWFTNSIRKISRNTTRIDKGFSLDTYYYTWEYQVR